MATKPAAFLTAEWRYLAMLNYPIDPAMLRDLVPAGTELDSFDGHHYVSIVGFLFLNTRVLRVPMPFHRDFEEVNLRFYVRRKADGEWRRGVVFIREIVPRRAVAWVANTVYGENYVALPMSHRIDRNAAGGPECIEFLWRGANCESGLSVRIESPPADAAPGSFEEFITEHYWGYARQRNGGTVEYRVEHPRWRVWQSTAAGLIGGAADFYGPAFRDLLSVHPASAFVADGSPVTVSRGVTIH